VLVRFSAWKAKMSTSVASSASTVTGAKSGTATCLEPGHALPRDQHAPEQSPPRAGTTMKMITE
jgi:hypothetical protein